MRKWLNYFVYISIIFLVYSLWRADYLHIPSIHNYFYLVISIVFLFAGYITKSIVWKAGLASDDIKISLRDGVASTGMAELGKYIPGKLWSNIGRAMYISENYPISVAKASAVSLIVQMLTIWSGLLVGSIGLFFIKIPTEWMVLIVGGWLLLSVILFTRWFHDLLQRLLNKILKRPFEIPFINIFKRKDVLFWLFSDWLIRITAFFFLILALTGTPHSFILSFGYPLAVTLGILAVIVPGGLGVREGVLTFWLSTAGLSIELAASIAIASRLWSLIGELGIFAVGLLLRKKKK